ncbi:hypothetical protein [Kitasatospora sp. NPDC087315]|uniref:hypothetical protein n=1 Tax=Kitasatospora sp. NPDC087315 TaxID=3364069 RepID=UPI0038115D18
MLPALLRHVLDDVRPGPADLAAVTGALRRVADGGGPFAGACAAYARAAQDCPGDPGLVAALLLNHVRLRAGQALFLDADVPHAYLHGVGVELTANPDNVPHCGLTAKHVDLDGLVAVTAFRTDEPKVLTAAPAGAGIEERFPSPAEEFRLSRLRRGRSAYPRPGAGPVHLTGPGAELFRATTGGRSGDGPAVG